MPDILYKEGRDRTETIPGATSLIKQLANTQNIEIDTVKEDRPRWNFDSSDNDGGGSDSSVSGGGTPSTSAPNSSLPSELGPDDSASMVDKQRHRGHKSKNSKEKEKPKTAEAIKREKAFALWKYKKCNPDNRYSPICLDMSNTLEEIEDELAKVKEENDIDNAVDILRSIMTSFVGGVEYVSKKQKFFDLRLSGWSETVAYEVDSAKYDGVFSELYDEWRDSVQMSPWFKLTLLLGGSAMQFHILNKVSENIPRAANAQTIPESTEIAKATFDVDEIVARMRAAQENANAVESELSGSCCSEESESSASMSETSSLGRTPPRTPPPRIARDNNPGTVRVSKLRTVIEKKRAEMTNPGTTRPQPTQLTTASTFAARPLVVEKNVIADAPPEQQPTSIEPPAAPPVPVATAPPVKPKRAYKRKVPPTTAAPPKPKVARKSTKSEATTFISETTAHPVVPAHTNDEGTIISQIKTTEFQEEPDVLL